MAHVQSPSAHHYIRPNTQGPRSVGNDSHEEGAARGRNGSPLESIVSIVRHRAAQCPDSLAFTYLLDGVEREATFTIGQIDRAAEGIAQYLRQRTNKGERALLMYPPGPEFIAGFLGCLYAGVVAVPAYPPRSNRHAHRLFAIARDAHARLVLTACGARSAIAAALSNTAGAGKIDVVETDGIEPGSGDEWEPEVIAPSDVAFLQYTSGSTGEPKGVVVTHQNIIANEREIQRASAPDKNTVYVSWLPLFHDMGLIGGVLQPLFLGVPAVQMSPSHFLQSPMRWLRAISKYRGTMSVAPNFAYDLCVDAAEREGIAGLDLSTWRVAWNGAEPIRPDTLERFSSTFSSVGFGENVHQPCYGLAESTLLVSSKVAGRTPCVVEVDQQALQSGHVRYASGATGGRKLVSSGIPSGLDVLIVDPATCEECDGDRVGEIWVAGNSVADGYWNSSDETQQVFHAFTATTRRGPFMRTGDLGFLSGQELFVTGRLKDVVNIRGRNLYPSDIESAILAAIPAVRPNACAAVRAEHHSGESLAIVVEADRRLARQLHLDGQSNSTGGEQSRLPASDFLGAIRRAVVNECGVLPSKIVIVKPGVFPRTSSGKVQRQECMRGVRDGTLDALLIWDSGRKGTTATDDPRGGAFQKDASPVSVQETLVELVKNLLKEDGAEAVHHIDLHEPLASIGIDSLAAVRLVASIEAAIGCQLEPELIHDLPTISSLASYIESLSAARKAERARQVSPVAIESESERAGTDRATPPPLGRERYLQRTERINAMRAAGHYFYESAIESHGSVHALVDGRPMLMFGSYSYLGLNGHPKIEEAVVGAVQRFGSGHHGVRLLAGTTTLHKALESQLASALRAEDSIVFGSGYTANLATITALVGRGDAIIADEWIHASLVDGCRLSGAEHQTFRHNDLNDLERKLETASRRHVLVVIDGVYSMEGDIAPVPDIALLCKRYGAMLMVDEAHSFGVLGATGGGIQEHFGLPSEAIDVKMATLSKAIPSMGGVVAGSTKLIDYLRHHARGYIFSAALPTASVAAASAAIDVLQAEPWRITQLRTNEKQFRDRLVESGLTVTASQSPIVPVLCRNEGQALRMTACARRDGLFVVPVTYPAVPMNAPRLRTCVMATHSSVDIEGAVQILAKALVEAS